MQPKLDNDDRAAIQTYWTFYEPLAPALSDELMPAVEKLPGFGPIIRSMTPAQLAEQNARSLQLQRTAILDGDWKPYLGDLRTQGKTYATMGVSFSAWFEIIAAYRVSISRRLAPIARENPDRAALITRGMNLLLDIAMAEIGEAYVAAKEDIIRKQREAILELSTPVLRVNPKVLILPLIGTIDTGRARQLTETLLAAVREHRARGVVIDITGVAVVDSKVANHLAQTCTAARLMGAKVVLTGISSAIAETLVTIGATMPGVPTLGTLEDGIQMLEKN